MGSHRSLVQHCPCFAISIRLFKVKRKLYKASRKYEGSLVEGGNEFEMTPHKNIQQKRI